MTKRGLRKYKRPRKAQGVLIAKELKLEFKGVWPGTKFFMFNVPAYGTSILASDMKSAKRRLKETKKLYGGDQ